MPDEIGEQDSLLRDARAWPVLRRLGPTFLGAFRLRAVPAAAGTLRAVEALREVYASGGRRWPGSLPTSFLRPTWRDAVHGTAGDARWVWEAATLLALRDRLRAGDIWVEGSRQWRAVERAVCFHRLGRLRDRTAELQHHRASGLALVTGAISLWNTVYLGRALDALHRRGKVVPDALLAHLAPIGWQHVNLTGDYLWGQGEGLGQDGFRPLRGSHHALAEAA